MTDEKLFSKTVDKFTVKEEYRSLTILYLSQRWGAGDKEVGNNLLSHSELCQGEDLSVWRVKKVTNTNGDYSINDYLCSLSLKIGPGKLQERFCMSLWKWKDLEKSYCLFLYFKDQDQTKNQDIGIEELMFQKYIS